METIAGDISWGEFDGRSLFDQTGRAERLDA